MEQTQQHLFCLPYKLEVIRNIKKVPVFVTDNKSKKYINKGMAWRRRKNIFTNHHLLN